MDPDCAICHALEEASTNLSRICDFIMMSQPKAKKDFGLHKSLVERHMRDIGKMKTYHEYFHATGEALSDALSGVQSEQPDAAKPQRFRRFGRS